MATGAATFSRIDLAASILQTIAYAAVLRGHVEKPEVRGRPRQTGSRDPRLSTGTTNGESWAIKDLRNKLARSIRDIQEQASRCPKDADESTLVITGGLSNAIYDAELPYPHENFQAFRSLAYLDRGDLELAFFMNELLLPEFDDDPPAIDELAYSVNATSLGLYQQIRWLEDPERGARVADVKAEIEAAGVKSRLDLLRRMMANHPEWKNPKLVAEYNRQRPLDKIDERVVINAKSYIRRKVRTG